MQQPGLWLAHKPRGATSSSLVRALQAEARADGAREGALPICHGGALDPFAEGLLLLLAGPATRLMEQLHPVPKQYLAEVRWGSETDNGDPLGAVIAEGDPSPLTPAALEAALALFLGWREQVPPATSNKRVGGERAWARAHRGEAVELPPVRVFLHQARWLSHQLPRSSLLSLSVRGGYYVRSLARDLGRALGCRAHLGTLSRGAIGPWRDPGPGERALVGGAALLPWLASRELTEAEAIRAELKRPIARGVITPPPRPLPEGFAGPGAAEGEAPAPLRGLLDGKLRLLLRARGGELVLHTDLLGGV